MVLGVSIGCNTTVTHNPPQVTEVSLDCKKGSITPYLSTGLSGKVYLSWQEPDSLSTSLRFSTLSGDQWSAPRTITTGSDWFVNWADFPVIAEGPEDMLVGSFLKKSQEGTYDYDIHLALSQDQGETWDTTFILHDDGIAAEHGFVSMQPIPQQGVQIAWLDGRQTKSTDSTHHGGAMSIRTSLLQPSGIKTPEQGLDLMVCDCCQTDVSLTANGPLVVYRDRSPQEIRDIAGVRYLNGDWIPLQIPQDHWKIEGCPVNGPRVDARGNEVVLAWFTGAENSKKVQWAASNDAGASFSPPQRIDQGNPMGRVDVALLPDNSSLVTWLEGKAEGAEILALHLDPVGKPLTTFTIAESRQSRGSGFPRMTAAGYKVYWAWTDLDSKIIRTAFLNLEPPL